MPAASIRLILIVAAIGSAGCGARGVSLNLGAAQLRLNIRGPGGAPSQKAIVDCVTRASKMVVDYCHRFPVPELEINVVRLPFGGIMGSTHRDGRYIKVTVGPAASQRVLRRDWVRTRELLHAAFPDVKRRHRWMQEGLSTFLETITRVNAGIWTGSDAWTYWTQMMPHGVVSTGVAQTSVSWQTSRFASARAVTRC